MAKISVDEYGRAFSFLDDLRKSNRVNMFGSVAILFEEGGLNFSFKESKGVVMVWMETFDPDVSVETRATKAHEKQ